MAAKKYIVRKPNKGTTVPAKNEKKSSTAMTTRSTTKIVKSTTAIVMMRKKKQTLKNEESADTSSTDDFSSTANDKKGNDCAAILKRSKIETSLSEESSEDGKSKEDESDGDDVGNEIGLRSAKKLEVQTSTIDAESDVADNDNAVDEYDDDEEEDDEEEDDEDDIDENEEDDIDDDEVDAVDDSDDDDEEDGTDNEDNDNNNKVIKKKSKRLAMTKNGNSDDRNNVEFADDDDEVEEESEVGTDEGEDEKGAVFTDENASWLKPTRDKLMSSDEGSDDDNSEEGDQLNDDDEMKVERQSRLLDQEIQLEKQEAQEELQRNIDQNTSIYHLPTLQELEEDTGNRMAPPSEIRERIDSILEVLSDFKNRREGTRARTEYVDQLSADLADLFGYLPELVEYFLIMFGPSETLEFLTASDQNRLLVIRTNTLKTRRKDLASALLKRGVTLDPLAPWSKVGLKITESPVPIGATPEYLSGHYMLQSAASLCAVMALSPLPMERVLDMSAAPGGKTSYIAQLMRNTGTIIANDSKTERQKATVANMHRLGVRNVITCVHDGRKLGTMWKNKFDRILLDAPCSGLGVISRDPSVKVQRTMNDVGRCGVLQKELILSAVDALKCSKGNGDGGIMVYSTCSVSIAENEEVVNYLLSKRDVKLVDTKLDFGKPGFTRFQQKRFHPSLALTRRFYPHVHNMDGFYVAKIQKISDGLPNKDTTKDNTTITEETNKTTEVAVMDEKDSQVENNEVDWATEVKKVLAGKLISNTVKNVKEDSTSTNVLQKPIKPMNKKKRKVDKDHESKKRKNVHVSVPPNMMGMAKKTKKKHSSTNAKVTKPRRQKAHPTD